MIRTLFVVGFFLSAWGMGSAQAATQYKILEVRGLATLGNAELTKNEVLSASGTLRTVGDSTMKIYVTRWDHTIVLGKNTEMEINVSDLNPKGNYRLLQGSIRWISGSAGHGFEASHYQVTTPNAFVGARGTDFFLSFNRDFEETELVVFDGGVALKSASGEKDERIVPEQSWGGIGGRFSANVRPPWKMNAVQVERFRRRVLP